MALNCTVSKFLVILGLLCIARGTGAYRSFGEVCQLRVSSPTDPNNCDRSAYLDCVGQSLSGVCRCESNLIWQSDLNTCTYPLGDRCSNTGNGFGFGDGHQGGNGQRPRCPNNAECGSDDKCKCSNGYVVDTVDDSRCTAGVGHIKNVLSTTFGLALCYFIATKMMM